MKHVFCIALVLFVCQAFSQKEITQQYEKIESYKDGLSWVYYAGMKGLMNEKGIEVIPCSYEAITLYKDNLYWIDYAGMKGLVDLTGNKIIPCEFEKITFYKDDLYWIDYAGMKGLYSIDEKKPVIKTSYEKIEPMKNGQFKVYYAGTEQIIALK